VGCAIVANRAPMPAELDEIVGAHPRIHTAEGLFYRDALCSGARALGLTPIVIAPRELDAHAAKTIGVRPSEIARLLIAAGRAVGRPWAKDQKMAALAAWSILGP
jgi:hypothetical protein